MTPVLSRISVGAAANRLGVPATTLQAAARRGDLRHVFFGRERVPHTTPAWVAEWAMRQLL
jgi:excisionase family DNA binding protein